MIKRISALALSLFATVVVAQGFGSSGFTPSASFNQPQTNATFKSVTVGDGGILFSDGTRQTSASSGGGVPTDITAQSIALSGNAGNSVTMAINTALCFDGAPCVTQSYWDGSQLFFNAGDSTANIDFDIGSVSALNLSNTVATLYLPLKLAGGVPGEIEDGNGTVRLNLASIGTSTYTDATSSAAATTVGHEFKTAVARTGAGTTVFQIDNGSSGVWFADKDGNTSQAGAGTFSGGVKSTQYMDPLGTEHLAMGTSSGNTYTSTLATGSTGTDHKFNTTAGTRTAGLLFDVQNNSTSKFNVDSSGVVTAAAQFSTAGQVEASQFEDTSNAMRLDVSSTPSIYRSTNAASSGTTVIDHEFRNSNTRTVAGSPLLQIDNGSTAVFDFDKDSNLIFRGGAPSIYTGTGASAGARRIALNTSGTIGNAFNGNVLDVNGNIANTFGNITTLTASTDYIAGFCAGDATSCSTGNAKILIDKLGNIIPISNGQSLGGSNTFGQVKATTVTLGANGGAASFGWASTTETIFTNLGTLYLIPNASWWTTTFIGEPVTNKSFQGVYTKTQQLFPLLAAGAASTGITCAAGVELQRVGIAGDATHGSQDCECINYKGTFQWRNLMNPTDATGTTTACPATP